MEPVVAAYHRTRFVKSNRGWILGVCEGIGKGLDINPNTVRFLFVVLTVFFGLSILIYPLLYAIMPRPETLHDYDREKLLGVCYQISVRTGQDLVIIRLLGCLLGLASFGSVLLAYFALFIYFELKTSLNS